eukprot:IDg13571t1
MRCSHRNGDARRCSARAISRLLVQPAHHPHVDYAHDEIGPLSPAVAGDRSDCILKTWLAPCGSTYSGALSAYTSKDRRVRGRETQETFSGRSVKGAPYTDRVALFRKTVSLALNLVMPAATRPEVHSL